MAENDDLLGLDDMELDDELNRENDGENERREEVAIMQHARPYIGARRDFVPPDPPANVGEYPPDDNGNGQIRGRPVDPPAREGRIRQERVLPYGRGARNNLRGLGRAQERRMRAEQAHFNAQGRLVNLLYQISNPFRGRSRGASRENNDPEYDDRPEYDERSST